jgi:hypothetical protein
VKNNLPAKPIRKVFQKYLDQKILPEAGTPLFEDAAWIANLTSKRAKIVLGHAKIANLNLGGFVLALIFAKGVGRDSEKYAVDVVVQASNNRRMIRLAMQYLKWHISARRSLKRPAKTRAYFMLDVLLNGSWRREMKQKYKDFIPAAHPFGVIKKNAKN